MPAIVIDHTQGTDGEKISAQDEKTQKMQIAIESVFQKMMVKQNQFEKEQTFDALVKRGLTPLKKYKLFI